jgi:hypothetical protein
MLASLSDKAVLERARGGSKEAVELLAKRFGYRISDPHAIVGAFRMSKFLSVSAAKRIIAANHG